MTDRGHADRLGVFGDLIDDSIGADAQRAQPSQSSAERRSGVGFPFEEPKRIFGRLDEAPVEC